MNGVTQGGLVSWLLLGGAVLLFAIQGALSVLLMSASSLSRVALRQVTGAADRAQGALDEFRSFRSTHRVAISALRQSCLVGGCVLSGLAADRWGIRWPWLAGALAGLVLGVLVVETALARSIALTNPRRALGALAFLAAPVHALTRPILAPVDSWVRRMGRRHRRRGTERDAAANEEELEAYIDVGQREGILEGAEGSMVRGIVDLGDTCVREIMTPRTDIVALPAAATVADARDVMLRSGHSRLPVYLGSIDNVVGILHVRDLMRTWSEDGDDAPAARRLRPPFFVPETRSTGELLTEMRSGTPLALVMDEYGTLTGLASLEDLLEEIVGDIREEHDREEPESQQESDGAWRFSGTAHVEEFERAFGVEIRERGFDTVAGLVIAQLGRVPPPGETLNVEGVTIEILEADRRRIYRVRASRVDAGVPPGDERG